MENEGKVFELLKKDERIRVSGQNLEEKGIILTNNID